MQGLMVLRSVLACLGMLLSVPVLAGDGATSANTRTTLPDGNVDVALLDGGTLVGQLVTPQGTARPRVAIVVRRSGQQVASTVTDDSGVFRVQGLRGGTCEIVDGNTAVAYRLWAPNTAPPSAAPTALLVSDGRQVLGQYGYGSSLKAWLANPWVVAGIITAAVAIPVGIHNHNLERTPASP